MLRNEALNYANVSAGHAKATAARCQELEEVLLIHDWTEFAWPCRDDYVREHLAQISKRRQGFFAHYSIAVSADGLRAPLGTLAMKAYVHTGDVDEQTRRFWAEQFGECERESGHWVEGFERATERLDGCSTIHVCDREADNNSVLHWLDDHEQRFVLRLKHPHKTKTGESFSEALDHADFVTKRTLKLSPRSFHDVFPRSRTNPERERRTAVVSFRSLSIEAQIDERTIPMQLVEAVERNPPKGEEPIHWILMTSEAADSIEEVLRVIDIYRSRWLVEEFFKAIKTGCAFRKRQLDSASTLLIALALTNAVGWRLLALRYLSRACGTLPAACLLNELQLALLKHEVPQVDWSPQPTVEEVTEALARTQGYGPSKGPPGWQVLGRGLRKLLEWETGANARAALDL